MKRKVTCVGEKLNSRARLVNICCGSKRVFMSLFDGRTSNHEDNEVPYKWYEFVSDTTSAVIKLRGYEVTGYNRTALENTG